MEELLLTARPPLTVCFEQVIISEFRFSLKYKEYHLLNGLTSLCLAHVVGRSKYKNYTSTFSHWVLRIRLQEH